VSAAVRIVAMLHAERAARVEVRPHTPESVGAAFGADARFQSAYAMLSDDEARAFWALVAPDAWAPPRVPREMCITVRPGAAVRA